MKKKSEIHEQIMLLMEGITEEKHMKCKDLHNGWSPGIKFIPGDRPENYTIYNGEIYKFIGTEEHVAVEEFNPERANYLYVKVTNQVTDWAEWVQPHGYDDAYSLNSKVSHNGKRWISEMDANVYEPGTYGWKEVAE